MRADRITIVAACITLAACSSPADKAKAKVDFLEKNGGTIGEICDAKRSVAQAYADAKDAESYQLSRVSADIDCQRAALDGRNAPADGSADVTMPDNLEAINDTTR
jgi:hypothetical protein